MKKIFEGMRRNNRVKFSRENIYFTMIELLVVISIITILACLLFPAFHKVKEKGKAIFCAGNLRQVGTAFGNYADDYNGYAPDNAAVANFQFGPYSLPEKTLCPYLGDSKGSRLAPASKCPSGRIDNTLGTSSDARPSSGGTTFHPNPSYVMNSYFVLRTWGDGTDRGAYCGLLSKVPSASQRMIYCDWTYIAQTPAWDNLAPRHQNGANVLFLDVHVKYYSYNEILNLGSGADAKNQFWHNDRQ